MANHVMQWMGKHVMGLVLLVCLSTPVWALEESVVFTFQNAATAAGNGASFPVKSYNAVTVQVTGISGDTLTFEGSVDAVTWVAVRCALTSTGSGSTTATVNGIYQCNTGGLGLFRVRISTYSAGTITATGIVTTAGLTGAGGSSTSNCPTDSGGTDTSDLTLHSCKSTIVNALQLTNIVTKSGLTLSGRTAWTNAGASGNLTIVAGIASQAIKVYEFEIWCNGANNWFIQSGTTNTPPTKHYTQNFAAGQNKIYDLRGDEWFIFRSTSTATDNDFIINFSAAQTCSGFVNYTQG